MFNPSSIYAIDIETDTTPDPVSGENYGLNDLKGCITEIVVATADPALDRVFSLDESGEKSLLMRFNSHLRSLKPGLIVDWNGTFFDLPFMHSRAMINGLFPNTLSWSMQLAYADEVHPKYEALPGHGQDGHTGGYSAAWGNNTYPKMAHQHLDISYAYKDLADAAGIKWSLKPVLHHLGFDAIELDRQNMHLYSQAERDAYVLSDGRGTRWLALRALGLHHIEAINASKAAAA